MVCNRKRPRGLVAAACLLALGFLAAGAGAARATITYGATDLALAAPDYATSFDGSSLADSDLVTNQFAGDGFTFSGGVRFRTCGSSWPNGAGGWTPSGYAGNNGPGCTRNTTDDAFSIHLAEDAGAMSFTSHSHMFSPASTLLMEVKRDGTILESFLITEDNDSWCCSPRYFRIDGLIFDEIRFSEPDPSTEPWIVIDNLAFDIALPEPVPLLLFGFGLAALGLVRSISEKRQTS